VREKGGCVSGRCLRGGMAVYERGERRVGSEADAVLTVDNHEYMYILYAGSPKLREFHLYQTHIIVRISFLVLSVCWTLLEVPALTVCFCRVHWLFMLELFVTAKVYVCDMRCWDRVIFGNGAIEIWGFERPSQRDWRRGESVPVNEGSPSHLTSAYVESGVCVSPCVWWWK